MVSKLDYEAINSMKVRLCLYNRMQFPDEHSVTDLRKLNELFQGYMFNGKEYEHKKSSR